MRRTLLTILLACVAAVGFAQRVTDKLNRGLVAVPTTSGGNFVSWHVFAEEYYDVTYNLYRNGSLIATNLKLSSYSDTQGNATSSYQVAAVVRGQEQKLCDAVTRWEGGMLTIPVAVPTDRDGNDASSHYTLNDVSIGDLDGDGIVEFIVKRKCDAVADLSNKKMFHQLDCYDHKGNRLWWIDLGPNMLAGADEQWDCVCYDWDMDGKAEVLLRIQDNAYIHYSDGSQLLIGSASVDTRWSGIEYTSGGSEYLLYLEGATGRPYEIGPASHPLWMDYPLTRISDSWWGSGIVGHRSTKHYWGAPFLDGRKASIFLGRGCYTNHKFTALDVDPVTHKLSQRWYWQTDQSSSPWWGNGYHNFAIGDVDWDGRDEIIFGSMIIDDNGLGLNTTSYGHGDAQHCSDFDPFRKYEEQFACLEEGRGNYGCNYRNAATGQILVKHDAGGDDGRALMANFTNDYPGSVGRSVSSGWISSVADKFVPELGGDAFINWGDLNQRIYWDGDLLDEYFDSPGTEGYGAIYKPASQSTSGGRWNFPDSKCNNWSKNNPGGIADIFGDWREELIMRRSDNKALLVYTTNIPTKYRIPTLWHDHQYRNAMVWQSMGYNQPPHKSYFLGELEGITVAPPPYTMAGRTEIGNGGTITTTDEHLLVCETNDTHITIQDGASPYMVTFNVPSWVQGTAAGNSSVKNTPINYQYFTCTVDGGALTGGTRLVKQGDGILTLPAADMTYTGETNIWAGTVNFNGSAKNTPVWLNRFGELNSNAASASFKSIRAEYGSVVRPGGDNAVGIITVDSIYYMAIGSRLKLDLYSDGLKADRISTPVLRIEKKNWTYGPQYMIPVIEVVEHTLDGANALEPGRYLIAHADSLVGSLANIKIEGVTDLKSGLEQEENGDIYLVLGSVRGASEIVWTGKKSAVWDYATTENFYLSDDETQTPEIFVKGDIVNFTDSAKSFTITLRDGAELPADTLRFDNTKAYTVNGNGVIVAGVYVKENTGLVVMSGDNTYTGGNYLRGGITRVTSLANSTQPYGNLGGVTTQSTKFVMENGAELQTTGTVKMGSPIRMQTAEGGVINNSGLFTMEKAILGTKLTKKGSGTLDMQGSLSATSLVVTAGSFRYGSPYNRQVTLQGSANLEGNGFLSTPIFVDEKANASITMTGSNYSAYAGKLTGSGTITFNPTNTVSRVRITANWSAFTGTVKHTNTSIWLPLDNSTGLPNGTLDVAEGATVTNTAKAWAIGKLTGKGSLGHAISNFQNQSAISGNNTWNVGNSSEELGDFTFAGTITDAGGGNKALFNKVGTCKMTVSGKWTNSGAVQVKAGELHLSSSATLGTGPLTVAAGATLSGAAATTSAANKAPMTNSSFAINGTLQIGSTSTSSSGYLNFGGKNVTFGSTATYVVGLNKCATATNPGCTTMFDISTLSLADGATISAYLSKTFSPTQDEAKVDSFRIFYDVANVSIGNLQFDLPQLPVGNYWITDRVQEGYLCVGYKATAAVRIKALIKEYLNAGTTLISDITKYIKEAFE